MAFSFSDTIAGYVKRYDRNADSFTLETTDGREFTIGLTATTGAQLVRNLGEPYVDATGQMRDMLVPGRFLFAYGVFYPQGGSARLRRADALTFPGAHAHDYVLEKPDWWVKQIQQMGNFYYDVAVRDGAPNWREYRVGVDMTGNKIGDRQETDTISRLIYGLSTRLPDDRRGPLPARPPRPASSTSASTCATTTPPRASIYWYHAIEINEPNEKKILASEFGDDYQAIPAYEQIYALVGPAQLYRITGDQRIQDDIDKTIALFEKFFYDPEYGGYWSHLDPISFDGKSDALGRNRARKNWNSVGDHIPAYLINTWLATGDDKYARHAGLDRRHHREALPGRRQQPVRPGAVPRGLEPRRDLGLAAEPGGRRAQPQDRLEPDAHPPRCVRKPTTSRWPTRSTGRCRRSAATSSAAAGTTWSSACARRSTRRPASPGTTARPGGSRSRRSSPT